MDHMLLPSTTKHTTTTAMSSTTPRNNTQSSTSLHEKQKIPSRIQFLPGSNELYGVINCNDLDKTNTGTSTSGVSSRLKSGPALLEIRRLSYTNLRCHETTDEATDDTVNLNSYNVNSFSANKMFHHESILVSRGISGGNVSSTCLSFRPTDISNASAVRCATGLTSGALCVHSLSNLPIYNSTSSNGNNCSDGPSSTVAHYAPRNQRPVTSVSWCDSISKNSRLVAIGLTGVVNKSGGGMMHSSVGKGRLGGMSGVSAIGGGGGDREFGCLVWDVEGQSGGAKGAAVAVKTPAYKYAHSIGVQSLSWLLNGQLLAVGSQKRHIQLYDLRVSGTNAPPLSVFAHSEAVSGIIPDVSCASSNIFASFGRNEGEPVKIWDVRMMDSSIAEIRPGGQQGVSAVAWSKERAGYLCIVTGDTIRTYDSKGSTGSRSLPVEVTYVDGDVEGVQDLVLFQPSLMCRPNEKNDTLSVSKTEHLLPSRILVVSSKGDVNVVPQSHIAPLSISKRDGRISHAYGSGVWIENATTTTQVTEDISARMMRRARTLHSSHHSTDASATVKILEDEKEQLLSQQHLIFNQPEVDNKKQTLSSYEQALTEINQLIRLWRWITLVEDLCREHRDREDNMTSSNNSSMNFSSHTSGGYTTTDESSWTARGLQDAGVLKLLKMSSRDGPDDNTNWMDSKSTSDVLFCDEFDSPMRRAALNACGWGIKKYGALRNLLDECESRGEYERSAALAVWHGNLGECVAALQRGADEVRELAVANNNASSEDQVSSSQKRTETSLESYAETLSLIAMVVAGFSMSTAPDGSTKTSTTWRKACESLLRRPDISPSEEESNAVPPSQGVSYLRAICIFLLNIGDGFNRTIYDEGLSLADRIGVAIRFLSRADLRSFLAASQSKCLKTGNLEGIIITGLDKRGVGIIGSYVDKCSDVQTAALIISRIIIPSEWGGERRSCTEWLESYRSLLNNSQLWHSRAAFDVARNEILRRLNTSSSNTRRLVSSKKSQRMDNSENFPPQIWARCNYCNSSLPLSKLRRQEGIVANSWLSRQKPVLTCCPTCKKPLPRCSICLLSLGCLNPYMELQRERNQYPRGGGGQMLVGGGSEDLSGLANIPFAEWFTWCMRCKHGGHAHHLLVWFSKHSSCAVSGCDCHCQFDGIQGLKRPSEQPT